MNAIAAVFVAAVLLLVNKPATAADDVVWDGNRTTPVHRLPLFDELGEQIVPSYRYSLPFSTITTCGTCHDYKTVRQGWHFNSSKNLVPAGRPGEPWVLVDELTATQLPLSYRGWPGMYKPEDVGLSEWEFTSIFARHATGGDFADPPDTLSDPGARWNVSGTLPINCLACHSDSARLDMGEWARQLARENFRWATTATSGIAEVDGMASRMRDSWSIFDGPDPDDQEFRVAPLVKYDLTQFDSKNKTFFEIAYRAQDDNCLQCHSVTPAETERWHTEYDVHSRAGMACADCHRNGLDHMVVRGYEGEVVPTARNLDDYESVRFEDPPGEPARNPKEIAHEFTCRGCHIGEGERGEFTATGARMGAPFPHHKGIPPIHFETMSCTTCHSGNVGADSLQVVRTSRINRLGIHGRAEWSRDFPAVQQPVYMRDAQGIIAPHRVMWPAFWGTIDGEKVQPLEREVVSEAAKGILDVQQQAATILNALGNLREMSATGLLAIDNTFYRARTDGHLQKTDLATTHPITMEWCLLIDGAVVSAIPQFDTTAEALEWEVEERILKVLEALEPLAPAGSIPALKFESVQYTRSFDGLLEQAPLAAPAAAPMLVMVSGESAKPLLPSHALNAIAATGNGAARITEEQAALMLKALADSTGQQTAFVSNGRLFKLAGDGKLAPSDHKAADPVAWPMGHNVLPASLSKGAKSCTECHAPDSDFFFEKVAATGPLVTKSSAVREMHSFMSADADYQRLFGNSFKVRSTYKNVLFVTGIVLLAVLAVMTLVALRAMLRIFGSRSSV